MRSFLLITVLTAFASCQALGGGPSEDVESYIALEGDKLLHYRRVGGGEQVLIVPGKSWCAEDMLGLADDRTVIFYDLRGRGRSDPAPIGTLRLHQDLEDLEAVRSWFGLERFALLGTDYKAALCALYAAEHPQHVERLVLVSPTPPRRTPYLPIYERVFNDGIDRQDMIDLGLMRREGVPRHDPVRWAATYRDALLKGWVAREASLSRMKSNPFPKPNNDPERVLQQYLDLLRTFGDWDWREDAAKIACPTLVVYGEKDPVPHEGSEEWTRSVPGARSYVVRGSGRMPWFEQSRSFISRVGDFLDAR
ncbi:MAG: alpha/beta hydrolase [Planctomycetota bacterium]|nr:alpha/beta hydrolase [Planctomycetota bacterium]